MRIVFCLFILFSFSAKSQTMNWDSLERHINSKVDTAKIEALYLSAYNLSSNFPDSALVLGNKALSQSLDLEYLRGIAESHNNIGTVFRTLSQYDSGESHYKKAIIFYKELRDEKGEGTALNNLGFLEQERGNYETASAYLLQSMQINEQIGNQEMLGSNYVNLGIVLSNMDRVDEAVTYYRKAIPIQLKSEDYQSLGNIYNNIAIEFRKEKVYDSALLYYKRSIKYREKAQDFRGLAATTNNLGILYFYLDKQDSTLILFKRALKTYERIGDRKEIARSYFNIAELHRMQGDYNLALSNLKLSLQEAKEVRSKEQIRDALLGLARVYAKIENFESAYEYRIEYEVYKDSLMDERNSRAVLEMTEKYESEKKDNQITQLELDQQLNQLLLAKSANQRNILLALCVIILIAAILLFLLFRNKRKSLREREILLKEIHHRVKNNLQVISSLLKLQAGSLQNEAAVDAIKEGQHRVKSMALIHQKLYSAEDIRGVDIQDYFENLLVELKQVFGAIDVSSNVNTSGLKMDIDTVIPLGLIMNELITNALKYAFVDIQEARLDLSVVEQSDRLIIVLRDNGVGMDELAMQQHNSFGWKMIRSLSRKVKAEIEVINNQGTTVTLSLARYKLVT
ncbi:MAG: hypothetical protein CMP48_05655 [Rickettsiales bacterium]|nr:hypothetical protein [Rickettsiales bacterium]